jgi:predicted Zn-dependent protease
VEEERKATDLDPYARPWSLGFALVMAHRVDDALHELRQRSQVHPDDSSLRESLAEVYRLKGMEKESVQELEKSLLYAGDKNSADAVHRAYKQGGLRGVDEWELQQLQKQAAKGYVSPHKYAALYAELGDKEQTLHFLELAYNDRAPRLIRLQLDPRYDFLHSEPRYRALVKKIGLAPAF